MDINARLASITTAALDAGVVDLGGHTDILLILVHLPFCVRALGFSLLSRSVGRYFPNRLFRAVLVDVGRVEILPVGTHP